MPSQLGSALCIPRFPALLALPASLVSDSDRPQPLVTTLQPSLPAPATFRGSGDSAPGKHQACQSPFLHVFSRRLQFLASNSDLFGAHAVVFYKLISSPQRLPPSLLPAQCWVPKLLPSSVAFSSTSVWSTNFSQLLTGKSSISFLHLPFLPPCCPQIFFLIFFIFNSTNAYEAGSVLRFGNYFFTLCHTCLPGVGCTYSTNRNREPTMYWTLGIWLWARQPWPLP